MVRYEVQFKKVGRIFGKINAAQLSDTVFHARFVRKWESVYFNMARTRQVRPVGAVSNVKSMVERLAAGGLETMGLPELHEAIESQRNSGNRPAQALKNGFSSDTTLSATQFRAPDGVTPRKSGSV